MESYLQTRGRRGLFDGMEFFRGCERLSAMVAHRDITVLLAKLYAEQMISSKERGQPMLLDSIPDLMLEYLNELNRKQSQRNDRAVHSDAKIVAWECLRQTLRPAAADIDSVLTALGGNADAEERFQYLEQKLRLVQTEGAGRDRVKFALDPLAEYLAGLYLVEHNRSDDQLWRALLARARDAQGAPDSIRGFLLALRDCCLAKGAECGVPLYVANELAARAGA
jgi:hypothetical protein